MPPVNRDAVILFDAQGNELSVINGQIIAADTSFLILAGRSPTNAVRAIKVAEDGTVATSGGGGAGGGTSLVDEAAFTEGVSSFTPVGGEFKDVGVDLTDGQAGVTKLTAKRAIHANLRTSAGTEIGTTASPVRTDPTGTTTQPVHTKTPLTASAPAFVAVGVASGVVIAANVNRKGLVLTNISNRTISFGLEGAAAVLDSGITLEPDGVWEMDEYTFTTGAINGIASGASGVLAIQEFA